MQFNATAVGLPRPHVGSSAPAVTSVQGLGLCDALRIELQPCQIAGVIDELDERRGPLYESFERARTRWDALAESEREAGAGVSLREELSKSAYALRVLAMLRGQLPTAGHDAPVSLVGPGSMISGLVAATVRNVVDELAELLRESPGSDARRRDRLRDAAAAAGAWVDTYIECEALEWFTFDPEWDPVDRMSY